MNSGASVLLVILILFISTFTRSALGFGDALVAMPLLAMVLDMRMATPLVAMAASTIASTILVRAWRQVNLGAVWRLVVSTLVGIPIGLYFLTSASERTVKAVLGVVLIGFGLYNLLAPRLPRLEDERLSYLFGLVAGILGGAYNANGPAVVVYSALRGWESSKFRATLQGYFLPTGLMILISHGLAGLWTREVLQLYVYSLPAIIVAVLLGGVVNRRVPEGQFRRVVYVFLIIIGALQFV